jgi:hypothetical protein
MELIYSILKAEKSFIFQMFSNIRNSKAGVHKFQEPDCHDCGVYIFRFCVWNIAPCYTSGFRILRWLLDFGNIFEAL